MFVLASNLNAIITAVSKGMKDIIDIDDTSIYRDDENKGRNGEVGHIKCCVTVYALVYEEHYGE